MLDDRLGSDGGLAGSGEHPDGQDLTFPDLPRLELDQLLAQLVERAQEVLATQGRLRGLLRANHMITGGLGLQFTLEAIGQSLRQLSRHRPAILLIANILVSVAHLLRLYVWREAFRKPRNEKKKIEPGREDAASPRQAQTVLEATE